MKVTKFDNELGRALQRAFGASYAMFCQMSGRELRGRMNRGKGVLVSDYGERCLHALLVELAESMRLLRNVVVDRTEPEPVCPKCKQPLRRRNGAS